MEVFTDDNKEERMDSGTRFLLEQMQLCLSHLDDSLAKEYRVACLCAPQLVAEETKGTIFLQVEDYKPALAAKRLALYWKYRKELFGERWLLKMSQTGSGTLTMADVEILRSGYFAGGDNTYVFDLSRIPKGNTTVFFPRVVFYVASTIPCTRVPEYNLVWAVHDATCTSGPANHETWAEMQKLRDAVPIKIKSCTVALKYEEGKECLFDFLGYKQQQVAQINSRHAAIVVGGTSTQSTLPKLQEQGCNTKYLPQSLGGDFVYDRDFNNWIRMRISVEDIMGGAPPVRNKLQLRTAGQANRPTCAVTRATNINTTSAVTTTTVARPSATVAADTLALLQKPSSRKRHRKTQNDSMNDLQDQIHNLERRNRDIRNDNHHLEALISQARLLVAMHGAGTTTTFERTRPPPVATTTNHNHAGLFLINDYNL